MPDAFLQFIVVDQAFTVLEGRAYGAHDGGVAFGPQTPQLRRDPPDADTGDFADIALLTHAPPLPVRPPVIGNTQHGGIPCSPDHAEALPCRNWIGHTLTEERIADEDEVVG